MISKSSDVCISVGFEILRLRGRRGLGQVISISMRLRYPTRLPRGLSNNPSIGTTAKHFYELVLSKYNTHRIQFLHFSTRLSISTRRLLIRPNNLRPPRKLLNSLLDAHPPLIRPPPILHVRIRHHLRDVRPQHATTLDSNDRGALVPLRAFGRRKSVKLPRMALDERHALEREPHSTGAVCRRRCTAL